MPAHTPSLSLNLSLTHKTHPQAYNLVASRIATAGSIWGLCCWLWTAEEEEEEQQETDMATAATKDAAKTAPVGDMAGTLTLTLTPTLVLHL